MRLIATRVRTLSILLAAAAVLVPAAGYAGEAGGHHAPVAARITDTDGSTRDVKLVAQSPFANARANPAMKFRTSTGEVEVYMDTLVSITDINDADAPDDADALFTFKRGKPRRLNFGRFSEDVVVQNDDGTKEVVDLRKIKALTIVPAAKRGDDKPDGGTGGDGKPA